MIYCPHKIISCLQKIISFSDSLPSFIHKIISCPQKIISCPQRIISCSVNLNCCRSTILKLIWIGQSGCLIKLWNKMISWEDKIIKFPKAYNLVRMYGEDIIFWEQDTILFGRPKYKTGMSLPGFLINRLWNRFLRNPGRDIIVSYFSLSEQR